MPINLHNAAEFQPGLGGFQRCQITDSFAYLHGPNEILKDNLGFFMDSWDSLQICKLNGFVTDKIADSFALLH